jgi:hypothetical protein
MGKSVAKEQHTWYNVRNSERFEHLVGKNISITGKIFYCKDGPVVHTNDKNNSSVVIKFECDAPHLADPKLATAARDKYIDAQNDFLRKYANGRTYRISGILGYEPIHSGRRPFPGGFAQGSGGYFYIRSESIRLVAVDTTRI